MAWKKPAYISFEEPVTATTSPTSTAPSTPSRGSSSSNYHHHKETGRDTYIEAMALLNDYSQPPTDDQDQQQQEETVPLFASSWEQLIMRSLIIASLLFDTAYIGMRWTTLWWSITGQSISALRYTDHYHQEQADVATTLFFFPFLILLCETAVYLPKFFAAYVSWTPVVRTGRDLHKMMPPSHFPTVDVFIPCYKEEVDLVRDTVIAALHMDYPADKLNVYVLDDGANPGKRPTKKKS